MAGRGSTSGSQGQAGRGASFAVTPPNSQAGAGRGGSPVIGVQDPQAGAGRGGIPVIGMQEALRSGFQQGTIINQNDPLFLSNSDHPGMQLVSNLFNGLNFTSWSRGIRMALGAKTKLGFINGTVPVPSEIDDGYDRWKRVDCMVMCWIINSMTSDIGEGFMFVQSSKALWDEIKERFSESNDPLIYQLHRELSNIRQENLSVAAYFAKLKKIWDELQAIEGTLTCECGAISQCRCALLKKIIEREARAKVVQFLMGLNDAILKSLKYEI